jgi:hypothetical protein
MAGEVREKAEVGTPCGPRPVEEESMQRVETLSTQITRDALKSKLKVFRSRKKTG